MPPALVTVPNVDLISVGIAYATAGGEITFTAEDAADIVASQDDPAIVAPRLKLSEDVIHGKAIANTPSFGVADNLRLGDNGQTVYCDFVGVPVWLAEIMPVAFPNRSVEGWQNWETVTGKKYGFVVTHIELLGVTWPGCSVLEDLPLYYGEEMPADVKVAASPSTLESDEVLHEQGSLVAELNARPEPVAASVNVDDVRRAYYETLNSDQNWWWIRAVYLEPNELIVDDDEGTLYRVGFAISGEEFTFEDPVEVKIEYVDVPKKKAAAVAVAAMSATRGADHTQAVFASKAESRPDKEDTVDAKALRESLGLAEDATDDEVKAKFEESFGEAGGGGEEPNPGDEGQEGAPTDGEPEPADGEPEPVEPAATAEPEPVAASARVVQVDKERLDSLERDAAAGAAARRSQLEAEADSLVKAAVEDGRIAPNSKTSWRDAILPKDATAIVKAEAETLASLAAGRIPVDERALSDGPDGADAATHELIMASFGVAGKD